MAYIILQALFGPARSRHTLFVACEAPPVHGKVLIVPILAWSIDLLRYESGHMMHMARASIHIWPPLRPQH